MAGRDRDPTAVGRGEKNGRETAARRTANRKFTLTGRPLEVALLTESVTRNTDRTRRSRRPARRC